MATSLLHVYESRYVQTSSWEKNIAGLPQILPHVRFLTLSLKFSREFTANCTREWLPLNSTVMPTFNQSISDSTAAEEQSNQYLLCVASYPGSSPTEKRGDSLEELITCPMTYYAWFYAWFWACVSGSWCTFKRQYAQYFISFSCTKLWAAGSLYMVYGQYVVPVLIDMAGFNSDSAKYYKHFFPYTKAHRPTW